MTPSFFLVTIYMNYTVQDRTKYTIFRMELEWDSDWFTNKIGTKIKDQIDLDSNTSCLHRFNLNYEFHFILVLIWPKSHSSSILKMVYFVLSCTV
jgi:hypothetical protein